MLTSIDKALSPIQELTETLSAERYVTVPAIMPVIQLIKFLCAEASDTDPTKALKQKIIEDFVHRYQDEEVTSLLDLSLILDPRFKVKYVRNVDEVLIHIKEEGAIFVREYQEEQQAAQSLSAPSSSDIVITLEPSKKKWKLGTLFKQYDSDNEEGPQLISPEQIFNTELERYLSAPKLDQEDVLPWWKEHNSTYPFLSK